MESTLKKDGINNIINLVTMLLIFQEIVLWLNMNYFLSQFFCEHYIYSNPKGLLQVAWYVEHNQLNVCSLHTDINTTDFILIFVVDLNPYNH